MKIRSYKREFVERVKQKFNDIQPSNKGNNNNLAKPCNDQEREKRNAERVAFRR